ncbi:hypothetical protein BDF14DRAFT_1865811 [Spinellus fusiger]|nr:hypothetical protein BDF14DRAFT_1865811 [Spinellus fusiger]
MMNYEVLFFIALLGIPFLFTRWSVLSQQKPRTSNIISRREVSNPSQPHDANAKNLFTAENNIFKAPTEVPLPYGVNQNVLNTPPSAQPLIFAYAPNNPADKNTFNGKGSDAPKAFWDTLMRRASSAVIGNINHRVGHYSQTQRANPFTPITSTSVGTTSAENHANYPNYPNIGYDRSTHISSVQSCPLSCNAKLPQQQQQPQQPQNTFGAFNGSSSIFTSLKPQTHLQTQSKESQTQPENTSLLSLKNAFPDVYVPHYIVGPDGMTRTQVTLDAFHSRSALRTGELISPKKSQNLSLDPRQISGMYGDDRNVLPPFLTANSNAHQRRMKKAIGEGIEESEDEHTRESDTILPGVFGSKKKSGFGFTRRERTDVAPVNKPPSESMWECGIAKPAPPSAYKLTKPFVRHNDHFLGPYHSGHKFSKRPTAVNVFGFPPDMLQTTMKQFREIGLVLEEEVVRSDWFTIRYTDADSAQKALKMNSTMIRDRYIMGVKAVNDEVV